MPEFTMPTGTSHREFEKLAPFVRGYITAALSTIDEEPGALTFDDLAPETLARMVKDCEEWQADNAALLSDAYERDYSEEQAGIDYWFTRNGHGAGFWDRGELEEGKLGDRLSDACRHTGVDLYEGDDGRLYLS